MLCSGHRDGSLAAIRGSDLPPDLRTRVTLDLKNHPRDPGDLAPPTRRRARRLQPHHGIHGQNPIPTIHQMTKPTFRNICQYLGLSCRLSVGAAVLIPAAQAGDTWVGGAAGAPQDWNNPANWGGAFPAGTNAFVNIGSAGNFPIISATPTSGTPVDIFVGNGAGATGRLDQTAGTASTGNGNWAFVGTAGGTGTFNLTGSGSFTAGTLNVGAWTGGTSNGTAVVNTTGSLNLTTTGNRNAAFGAASLLVAEGGGNNSGTFELQNGTVNAAANTVIAHNTTGTGTFKMSGGLFNNTGQFIFARSAPATATHTGGILNSTSFFVVGRDNLGNGTYNLSGGTINAATASGFAVMGSFSGAQGHLNVGGGTFNSTVGGMIVGEGGTGTLTVSGSGLVDIGAVHGYQMGAGATGVGTIHLNGGTMQGNRVYKGAGTGTFNFNGGTLKATAATATFFNLGATNARANVRDGGAIIDSNGFDVTVEQSLEQSNVSGDLGTGGLTKTGAGKLTLSGANTYTGQTNVNGGTLELSLAGTLASNVVVASTATLTGNGISTNSVTFQGGSTLATPVEGPLEVNGVSFTGPTNLVFTGTPQNGSQYTLIKYGAGGVTGISNLSSTFRTNISNDAANSQVIGTVTTATINWNTTNGTWANNTGGWGGESTSYFNGDTVSFGERSGPSTVTLTGVLLPASVTVSNTSNPYTFTGAGSISGVTSLVKEGAGALTIATANSYTGGTILGAGTLNIDHAAALGSPVAPSSLIISGSSTLNNTSGAAIAMTGNTAQNWDADFSFTGTNSLDMGSGGVTLGGTGDNRTVTVAANTLTVGEITGTFQGLVKQGAGTLEVTSTGAGAAASRVAGTLNVAAGTLQFNRANSDAAGSGDFTAAGLTGSGTVVNGAAVERWFFSNPASGSFNFTGTLANGNAGGLGFNKSGDGTQVLSGTLSYTGQTTLENGTGELVISANNSGAGTNAVVNSGKLTLANTQSLGTASLIRLAGVNVSTLELASDSDGTAYAFTMGTGTTTTIISNRATAGAGINHTLTTQALANGVGGGVINITSGANVTSGTGRITFTQLGLGAGSAQTTTLNPTTANVTIGTVSKQNNNQPQTLDLGGTSLDNHITGVISNGPPLVAPNAVSVIKTGTSTWSLEGLNTYTGATTVSGGTLIITQSALADAAAVNLNAPGVLNLPNAGTDTVDRVFIDGVEQVAGTWGSLTSSATNKTARITGPGILLATNGAATGGFGGWANSFGLTGGDAAAGVDKDGDSYDNGTEYILGGSPVSGSNNPKIHALTADTNADTQKELVMTIAVPVGTPVFPAGTAGTPNSTVTFEGYTIEVRGSTTLNGFPVIVTPVTPLTTGLPALPAQGGINYEYRSFSLSGSNGLVGKGFLQVRVTNPAP